MRTKVLTSFAACLLAAASCQKNVVEPEKSLQSAAANNSTSSTCDVIGFTNASSAGFLTQVNSDGGLGPIAITSYSARTQTTAARVFDSANPHYEDPDLGTPNQVYGGPGIGTGGESGPFANTIPLGNLLVIQNPDYSDPNDDDVVGQFTFNFSSIGPITATSITVIDLEGATEQESGSVKLYATASSPTPLATFLLPDTGADGVGVVSLGNTPGVGYIVVDMDGSMGIDNLGFCREVRSQCTYTLGYWKNHESAWPVTSLTLGTVSYTKAQLLMVLKTPVRGNGLISLAHQLIAAKLNIANGSSGAVINSTIASADALIGGLNLFTGSLPTSQTSTLTSRLDSYNNGKIGPGHCD